MAVAIENDPLTERIIGFAIEIHRHLGPGLLESAYEECLCYEIKQGGIASARQTSVPVVNTDILENGIRRLVHPHRLTASL